MSSIESNHTDPSTRHWSVAEQVFGEVPTGPVGLIDVAPEPVGSTDPRIDLRDALGAWADRHDLEVDHVSLERDEHGNLAAILEGLTLDENGDIVRRVREYRWTGTVTIEVEVSGTVEAVNQEYADDAAEEALSNVGFHDVSVDSWGGDITVNGQLPYDYSITDVDER